MNRKEFQRLAVRTESIVDKPKLTEEDYMIFLHALQAFDRIVEVLDAYKKYIFYRDGEGNRRTLDYNKIREHVGTAREHLFQANTRVTKARQQSYNEEAYTKELLDDSRVLHALLGTITEHGEISSALITALLTGELDLVNVCEELGDSDWYKALFYEATGINWEAVQSMVIKKLEIRYADKIFNAKDSENRDLVAERELLESVIQEAVEEYKNGQGGTV